MPDGVDHYRILVIDDNPAIHDDFRKVLAGAKPQATDVNDLETALFGAAEAETPAVYEIDTAGGGQEGLDKVRASLAEDRPYAMVFCDMRMPPGWDGVQTLRELWKASPSLQAAICTAYSDYTPEQIAAGLGVNRRMVILRKPFDPTEVRQLAGMVCEKWQITRRQTELSQSIEARTVELQKAAMYDALTGLPNRTLFAERLAKALRTTREHPGHRVAVLFIDCDNFKTVNDTLGHQAGDALLQQVAQRLDVALREQGALAERQGQGPRPAIAARIGGDEFAILLDGIAADTDATSLAARLLEAAAVPYMLAGRPVRSAMSVGVTTTAIAYAGPDEMMRDADAAMYAAKRGGRGRFVVFDQAMHDAAVARIVAEAELRQAVDAGQIRPHFQPIIATADRKLVGFEALARWHHPTRGLLLPSHFIPLAEECGVIVPLGLRILDDACTRLAAWHRAFPAMAGLTMSVNLSRQQLTTPDLVEQVAEIIRRTGIEPRHLKLEVTESTVLNHARGTGEVLNRLSELNVQLHLDDFGTGYSSLNRLRALPLSGLKLDNSFVCTLNDVGPDNPLLNAMTTLAQGLNVPMAAEGIESDSQFRQLKLLGCDTMQGFLFARPMDAAAATAFVAGLALSAEQAA